MWIAGRDGWGICRKTRASCVEFRYDPATHQHRPQGELKALPGCSKNVVWHVFVSSLHEQAARGSIQNRAPRVIVKQQSECLNSQAPLRCRVVENWCKGSISMWRILRSGRGFLSRSTSPKCRSGLPSHRLTRVWRPGKKMPSRVPSLSSCPEWSPTISPSSYILQNLDEIPTLIVTSPPDLGRSTLHYTVISRRAEWLSH